MSEQTQTFSEIDNTVHVFSEQTFGVSAKGNTKTVSGYALVWNVLSQPGDAASRGFAARLLPGSAKFMNPTFGLFNHDSSNVLARSDDGSLRLSEDEKGVKFEMDLPETQLGRDLDWLVTNGKIRGMSFAMKPKIEFDDANENGTKVRNFKSYGVSEITITPFPAFKETTVTTVEDVIPNPLAMSEQPLEPDHLESENRSIEEFTREQSKLEKYRLDFFRHLAEFQE